MEGHRERSLAREYTPRVRLGRLVADPGNLLGGGAIVDRDRLDHEARKRRHHRGEQAGSKGKYLMPARRGAFREQRYRRSEEHTSELQSLMRISYAVFCLKKKKRLISYKTQ